MGTYILPCDAPQDDTSHQAGAAGRIVLIEIAGDLAGEIGDPMARRGPRPWLVSDFELLELDRSLD